MATRIENSRTAKRVQGTMTWDTDAFTAATGRVPRLDLRGFPNNNGADTTRVTYSDIS